MARLEQVTALVVAAGLAIVSYWLFFSWAGGGDGTRRPRSRSEVVPEQRLHASAEADGVMLRDPLGL